MLLRFYGWVRMGILVAFALTFGWLSVGVPDTFASPDERANAFFGQHLAEHVSFCAQEPLNRIANGLIHPRSTVAPGTCILPASFLGLPSLLAVVRVVGSLFGPVVANAVPYFVTPSLAVAGILAWWFVVRRLTQSERLADITAMLVLTHPAFWYYSARVMMHNVPFVALLMIAGAVGIAAHDRRSSSLGLCAGVLGGLALTMRLVELPLVLTLSAVAGVVYRRAISRNVLLWGAFGALMILGGYALVNISVYGSLWTTGYTMPDLRVVEHGAASAPVFMERAIDMLFPFGFHPWNIFKNVLAYGFQLYPMLSILSFVGVGLVLRTQRRGWRVAALLLFFASCWMAAVYGSWLISDNIDPDAVTVGNSHVRYWLPLFVGSSVFVAYVIDWFMARSRAAMIVGCGVLFGLVFMSARTVFGGTDGFFATRAALLESGEKREMILAQTGCSATESSDIVIIVDHADKYIFPTCRVLVPLRSESTYDVMPKLVDGGLYYFGLTLPEADLVFLNMVKLAPMHLRIEALETTYDQTLYLITRNTSQNEL